MSTCIGWWTGSILTKCARSVPSHSSCCAQASGNPAPGRPRPLSRNRCWPTNLCETSPSLACSTALTPAITVADGNSVIAVETSGNGLRFYWNEHGTNTWHGEQVAADGTTFSSPSVAQAGGHVVIAAQGADGSLDVYWQPNGGDSWASQVVAGANTTNDAPSVTADGSSVIIAGEGAFNSLDFYWAANGSSTWTREVVAGSGAIQSAPAITANDGSVNVTAILTSHDELGFYWAVNGTTTWTEEILPDPGFGFYGTPAITTDTGGVHVVANGKFGVLSDDATSNGIGTCQLTALTVGSFLYGSPYVGIANPAVTMNDGIENIANVGSDGNLYFWWYQGDGGYFV
jgi:hypothetical protein